MTFLQFSQKPIGSETFCWYGTTEHFSTLRFTNTTINTSLSSQFQIKKLTSSSIRDTQLYRLFTLQISINNSLYWVSVLIFILKLWSSQHLHNKKSVTQKYTHLVEVTQDHKEMSHFSFTQTHTYKRKIVPSPIGDIVQLYFYIFCFCFVSICLSNTKERHMSMFNVVEGSFWDFKTQGYRLGRREITHKQIWFQVFLFGKIKFIERIYHLNKYFLNVLLKH
jgi:hypothetical protein